MGAGPRGRDCGPWGSPHFLLPGPQGLLPAGIRLMPHTVLTFVFLEQLRKHFGVKVLS